MTTATAARRPIVHPRIGRRRAAVTRERGRRRLRLFVAGLVIVALGVGALVVGHSPLLSARHVEVTGARHTPVSEVMAVTALGRHPPLLDVDPSALEQRIEQLPWVRSARVSLGWPDAVHVALQERVPAAVTAGVGAQRGQWALVDGTGRVLGYVSSILSTTPALPVLVTPSSPGQPGSTLRAGATPALAVVRAVAGQLPLAVRSVIGASGGTVTLELTRNVQAKLGTTQLLAAKVAALRSVLVGAPPPGPEVIDVTVPSEPTVAPAPA